MRLLVIDSAEVRQLLPMRECMEVMARAFEALARGEAANPLRGVLKTPDGSGVFGTMPAMLSGSMGVKLISVFPGNHGSVYASHQGLILLSETMHGCPIAILDASSVTAVRTAAVSGVATKALAREDAAELALLGSGVQAVTHLEAVRIVRPISRVRVWSPNAANARAFAERESARHGIEVTATATAREAVEGAEVICTVTSSSVPVVEREWLAPGAHVNAVGACTPSAREIDTATLVASRLFVDRCESAFNEAGDFLIPRGEGAITDEHIVGELGDVLIGRIAGRESATEITLFESLGLGIEDVAAARYVYDVALRKGAGTWVDLGG